MQLNSYRRWFLLVQFLLLALFVSACSTDGKGFHLRHKISLADKYQNVSIEGLERDSEQFNALKFSLQEAGSTVVQMPDKLFVGSTISIQNLREGRRVIAYTSERKVREYLLYLKFDYVLSNTAKNNLMNKTHRINLDRSFLYDARFVLGKTEEERQIRKGLYKEAARLILLKMQATR